MSGEGSGWCEDVEDQKIVSARVDPEYERMCWMQGCSEALVSSVAALKRTDSCDGWLCQRVEFEQRRVRIFSGLHVWSRVGVYRCQNQERRDEKGQVRIQSSFVVSEG